MTTFISSRQLVATITAADIELPGGVLVSVFNPPAAVRPSFPVESA